MDLFNAIRRKRSFVDRGLCSGYVSQPSLAEYDAIGLQMISRPAGLRAMREALFESIGATCTEKQIVNESYARRWWAQPVHGAVK
jgi:hypothetical protein